MEELSSLAVLVVLASLVPESWVMLCSMGPGMWSVDEEVVSWARAVVRRTRMVSVSFMFTRVDVLFGDVVIEAKVGGWWWKFCRGVKRGVSSGEGDGWS